jgi:hypothetical protein
MSYSVAVRRPVVTAMATGLAAVAAVLQYAQPGVVPALERVPDGLAHGQWWRLVTPLAVQTLGWYQVAANLVTLPLVGAAVEVLLGRWRWLLLAAAGTAGGQLAAYAWGQWGGGDSIAICGLAGGLAVVLLADRRPPPAATWIVVLYIAALAGWGVRGPVAAALAVTVAAALGVGLRRLGLPPPAVDRLALLGCVLGAPVLALRYEDLHGASLTAAMAVTALALLAAASFLTLRRSNTA